MQNLFPDMTIADANELNQELTESDMSVLDLIEREQIRILEAKKHWGSCIQLWD